MTPRVVVDARMVGMGGIGRYTESLVAEMIPQRPAWNWILVGDPDRLAGLAGLGRAGGGAANVEVRECRARVYSAEEAFGMERFYRGADLVHVPHFNAPLFCRTKLIVTIHDLIHFDYPEYQPFPGANRVLDWKLRRLLKQADSVLAVSRATADALQKRYASPELSFKLHVVWEAADISFSATPRPDDAERLRRLGVDADPRRPLVLYVGAIREHKAVQLLTEAFRALTAERPELSAQLMLCGKIDARFERKHQFSSRLRQTPGVVHAPDASDRDLAALYRRAAVAVMPSRVEGFGLPAVEAMQTGTPLIISDTPALREIAGSAALTFPSGRVDGLQAHLYNVLTDAALRARLSRDGREHSRQFNWRSTAAQTLEIYESIL